MDHDDYVLLKKEELRALVNQMLAEEVNLIEAVREICDLRHEIDDPDNEIFMLLRAIDSETDHIPLGKVRSRCCEKYLKDVDREIDEYLRDTKHYIFDSCREILIMYKVELIF